MDLPSIDRFAANFTRVIVGPVSVWYSYNTPVAFSVNGSSPVVRANAWGNTTGKHINAIDGGDRAARLSGEDFAAKCAELAAPLFGPLATA